VKLKNENIQVESGIHPSFYDRYYRGLNLPKENEHVLTIFPTFRVFSPMGISNTFFSMQGIPQNSGQILFVLLEINYYSAECEIESSKISHVSLNLPGNPILFSAYPGKWTFFAWISTNDADGSEKLHFCSLERKMVIRLPELQQHITSLVDKPGPGDTRHVPDNTKPGPDSTKPGPDNAEPQSSNYKTYIPHVIVAGLCILAMTCLLSVMKTPSRLPQSSAPRRSRKTNMHKKSSVHSKNSSRRNTSTHDSKRRFTKRL